MRFLTRAIAPSLRDRELRWLLAGNIVVLGWAAAEGWSYLELFLFFWIENAALALAAVLRTVLVLPQILEEERQRRPRLGSLGALLAYLLLKLKLCLGIVMMLLIQLGFIVGGFSQVVETSSDAAFALAAEVMPLILALLCLHGLVLPLIALMRGDPAATCAECAYRTIALRNRLMTLHLILPFLGIGAFVFGVPPLIGVLLFLLIKSAAETAISARSRAPTAA